MSNLTLNDYDSRLHRWGKKSTIIFLISLICVPLSMNLIWGVGIDIKTTAIALMSPLAMFLVVGTVECLTIAPILGPGGTYISFNTGNTLNIKMPAAVSCLKLTGYEALSKEANIVSMVAICVSAVTTMVITFLGMIFISAILPVLQAPILQPAFDNFMPALLGALIFPMIKKDFKTAIVPCVAVAIVTLVFGYSLIEGIEPLIMPIFLAIAVAWKYHLYKKSGKGKEAKKQNNEAAGH